jgi:hypothetical protein
MAAGARKIVRSPAAAAVIAAWFANNTINRHGT